MRAPVWAAFVAWLLLQGLDLLGQAYGVVTVSAAAHLGGVLAGALAFALEEAWSRATAHEVDRAR